MINYDLSFETVAGNLVMLSMRKVVLICVTPDVVSIESSKDGWFEFATVDADGYERPFYVTTELRGRLFVVSENELHKIKLQLGLE
jgi:hypothetical protein